VEASTERVSHARDVKVIGNSHDDALNRSVDAIQRAGGVWDPISPSEVLNPHAVGINQQFTAHGPAAAKRGQVIVLDHRAASDDGDPRNRARVRQTSDAGGSAT